MAPRNYGPKSSHRPRTGKGKTSLDGRKLDSKLSGKPNRTEQKGKMGEQKKQQQHQKQPSIIDLSCGEPQSEGEDISSEPSMDSSDRRVDPESRHVCFFIQRPEMVWSLVEWSCGDFLQLPNVRDILPRLKTMILALYNFLPQEDFTNIWKCFPARVAYLKRALYEMILKIRCRSQLSILDRELFHMLTLHIGRLVGYFGFGYDDYASAIWQRVVHRDLEYRFLLPPREREKWYPFWRKLHFAVPGCDCYQCVYILT